MTAARHFEHRLQKLFSDLILGPSCLLGKITNYCYRIEFQQRGSPHAHCVLWMDKAPKLGDSQDREIVDSIDRFVTCALPCEQSDKQLFDVVNLVQRHNHSVSCRKGSNKACRFSYPRPPSDSTVIAKPIQTDNPELAAVKQKQATEIMTKMYGMLEDDTMSGNTLQYIIEKK